VAFGIPVVVALGARLVGVSAVFPKDGVRLIDEESYYHAHRIGLARRHCPRLPPVRDPLLGYPEGKPIPWPPGLHFLGGVLARVCTGCTAPDDLSRLGTLLLVVLGALSPLPLVALLRRYTSLGWAALGGLYLALSPAVLEWSKVGRISPLGTEPLLFGFAVLLYFRAAAAPAGRRWWLMTSTCGALLAAAGWVSPMAAIPTLVLGVGMLGHQVVGGMRPVAAVVLGVAALLSVPLCATLELRDLILVSPSPLHLVALVSLCLVSLVLRRLGRGFSRLGDSRGLRTMLLLGGAALWGLAVVVTARAAASTFAAPPDLHTAFQARPLAQRFLGDLPPGMILDLLTYFVAAWPLLAGLALVAPLPRERRAEVWVLAFWAGTLLLLGALRLRFLPTALTLAIPLCALGVAEAARRVAAAAERRARPAVLRLVRPGLGVASLCLLWPTCDYLTAPRLTTPGSSRPVEEAAHFFLRQGSASSRGVLAPWSLTFPLVHLGHVSVVGVPPGLGLGDSDARDTLTFFITDRFDTAQEILARRGVEWVVITTSPSASYAGQLRHLGRSWRHSAVVFHHRRSMGARLVEDLGSGKRFSAEMLPALPWLQHRWESTPLYAVPPAHLFRVVKGAWLLGRAAPASLVELRLPLISNRGRPFAFRDFRRAGRDGRYRFRLPYATADAVSAEVAAYLQAMERLERGRTHGTDQRGVLTALDLPHTIALGPARVHSQGWEVMARVTADDVVQGKEIQVPPAPATDAVPPAP
jgi:asparagine N-glycosylation enzyme membrane subunit Stt3